MFDNTPETEAFVERRGWLKDELRAAEVETRKWPKAMRENLPSSRALHRARSLKTGV